jgi:branched-chain amino acid transport system ATP-binding protein
MTTVPGQSTPQPSLAGGPGQRVPQNDATNLRIDHLTAGYGRVQVVSDFTVRVEQGEVVSLVGRNGAGKTTALAAVAGLRYAPAGGTVYIGDKNLSGASPNTMVTSGLGLVPEGRRIFKEMTVLENLRLGAYTHRRQRKLIEDDLDRVHELFPILAEFSKREVGGLSGGQQQMIAIGQALMGRPQFLLLDEPASGVAPVLVDEIYDRLHQLVEGGLGLILVDQSIERALEHSSRFYVMDSGTNVLFGDSSPAAIEDINPIVLGSEGVGAA